MHYFKNNTELDYDNSTFDSKQYNYVELWISGYPEKKLYLFVYVFLAFLLTENVGPNVSMKIYWLRKLILGQISIVDQVTSNKKYQSHNSFSVQSVHKSSQFLSFLYKEIFLKLPDYSFIHPGYI